MSDQLILLAGLGVYLVAMVAIGAYAARRVTDTVGFIVAGRNLSMWLCTSTLMATWMGAGIAMGAAGAAYEEGFLGVIADPFGGGLCMILVGAFCARMMRRMGLMTIATFFDIKYGPTARMLTAVAQIISYTAWVGSNLVAFGYILHTLVGVSTTTGIVVATVIVLTYTAAGGMWAVALTDFVQILILTIGFMIMLPILISDLGGWQAAYAALPEGTFRMIPQQRDWTSWLQYVRAWAIIGIGSIPAQDLLQRAMASRNETVAHNSLYLAGVGYWTIGVIPVLLGVFGALSLPGLEDPEFILPQLALQHLHVIPMTIFVGALLAAVMSTADSALLAPASVLSTDLVPFFFPRASDWVLLACSRWAVPFFGLASLVIALSVRTVYDLMVNSASVMLVALLVPFVAGMWWPRANRFGALASMLTGASVWIGLLFAGAELPADLIAFAASLLALLLVTPLTQRLDPPRPLRDVTGKVLPYRDRLGVLNPFDREARQRREA